MPDIIHFPVSDRLSSYAFNSSSSSSMPSMNLSTSLSPCMNHAFIKYEDVRLAFKTELQENDKLNMRNKCMDSLFCIIAFIMIIVIYVRCSTIISKLDIIINNMNIT